MPNRSFGYQKDVYKRQPWYIVSWNELGELTSLYDKEAKREVLEAGTVGNEIVVYEDIPKDYDAWNVESYYSRKHWKMSVKKPCMMTEAGEICAVLHTELSYESSVIEQDIAFFAPVSYTHLDVYKRQLLMSTESTSKRMLLLREDFSLLW